jgi:hypothetical protein
VSSSLRLFVFVELLFVLIDPASPKRQSAPSPPIPRVSRRHQAQGPCVPRLYPSRRDVPRNASVPGGRVPVSRMEHLRLMASNYSTRHSALGVGRRARIATKPARISLEYRSNQYLREIHHQTPRPRYRRVLRLGFLNQITREFGTLEFLVSPSIRSTKASLGVFVPK